MIKCNLCQSSAIVVISKCEDEYCIHCLNCDKMGWIGYKDNIQRSKSSYELFFERLKKYHQLIDSFTKKIYYRYNKVMDYEDSYQEVLMCLWRCCVYYQPDKTTTFKTYFVNSLNRLLKRLYYSYVHQIRNVYVEQVFGLISSGRMDIDLDIVKSIDCDIFNCAMKHSKVSERILANFCNLSLRDARRKIKRFKDELALLLR